MFLNYLKVAWRNLIKRKIYTAIMILGLAVGLSFSLIIGSFVYSEYQVNQKIKNVENHYLITSLWAKPHMGIELTTMAPLAKTLKDKYPDLIQNSYSFDAIGAIVKKEEEVHSENVQLGDPEMLKMYGFPLLYGDIETALHSPFEIVISEKVALKYFGRSDVLNETLEVESFSRERRDFIIKGVLGHIPFNSITHLVYKEVPILMSNESLKFFDRHTSYDSWSNAYVASYIELKKGVEPGSLDDPIAQILKENTTQEIFENLSVILQPLSSLHLSINDGYAMNTLHTLILIGIFILFMAIVNFINITIGNSAERLKEMGVRKTIGGQRRHIIIQFLVESVVLTGLSLSLALFIYETCKEYFIEILGKPLPSFYELSPHFIFYALIFSLSVGLLSGLYPALSLSSLPTVTSLKGQINSVKENLKFRLGLVTLQFATALFVIVATFIVSEQIDFLFDKDLGYDKEQVIHIRTPRDWSSEGVSKMITIRNELSQLPDIKSASLAYEIPDGNAGYHAAVYRYGQEESSAFFAPMLQVDDQYLNTYEIELAEGRNFRSELLADEEVPGVLINETAVKSLGIKNSKDAIDVMIHVRFLDNVAKVIGVVKDFHFGSMHEKIKPIILANVNATNNYRYLAFKINSNDINHTLQVLEAKWNELLPNSPFNYNFLDITLQNLYQSEIRLKKAARIATFLSFIIVLIGVLGLVSISVSRRNKEVGIRKVLGASPGEINWLFLREFMLIALFSIVLVIPLLYYFGGFWLDNFAYRIDIDFKVIIGLAFIFCLTIALVVVVQIFNKIRVNPVDSLRAE